MKIINLKNNGKIINIIMERDDIDYETAKSLVNETVDEIIQYPEEAYDIVQEYLGLEPDYLEYLLP